MTASQFVGCMWITGKIGDIRHRMEAAAALLDFEEAERLRDQISLLCGSAALPNVSGIGTCGLLR